MSKREEEKRKETVDNFGILWILSRKSAVASRVSFVRVLDCENSLLNLPKATLSRRWANKWPTELTTASRSPFPISFSLSFFRILSGLRVLLINLIRSRKKLARARVFTQGLRTLWKYSLRKNGSRWSYSRVELRALCNKARANENGARSTFPLCNNLVSFIG